ncbi:MAG: TRAP transporter large permease subunit [Desulfobacterales bacterium]|nr:TRAP transporter large permease subunit [Desulfobacterales bacterium]
MSIGLITILLFASMIFFIALGLPIAFSIGGVSVIFGLALWGPISTQIVAVKAITQMRTIILIAVPLFIFMATMLERSGIADDLYEMMHRWMGTLRGGLAMGTVFICTIFAAMSGISGAGTVTMGIIALPNMLKRGYDKSLAIGCIMAGGALGVLIPPSVIMIIYGLFSRQSVGKLFAGGLLPGLLLSTLFVVYIGIRCYFNPRLGPILPPEERASWQLKLICLRAVILPLLLVVGVLGSIFLGMATPTEAASVGSFGAIICAAIHRRLGWSMLMAAAKRTLRTTAMIMWIILASAIFCGVYQGLGAAELMEEMLMKAAVSKWLILGMIQLSFLILGCFVDPVGILMMTTPVYLPVITFLGFDPLWYGIVFVVNMEMAFLTPPFGSNLFYMKGVAPKDVTMLDIYRSITPFVLLQMLGLALVIAFPQIALFLPSLLFQS